MGKWERLDTEKALFTFQSPQRFIILTTSSLWETTEREGGKSFHSTQWIICSSCPRFLFFLCFSLVTNWKVRKFTNLKLSPHHHYTFHWVNLLRHAPGRSLLFNFALNRFSRLLRALARNCSENQTPWPFLKKNLFPFSSRAVLWRSLIPVEPMKMTARVELMQMLFLSSFLALAWRMKWDDTWPAAWSGLPSTLKSFVTRDRRATKPPLRCSQIIHKFQKFALL